MTDEKPQRPNDPEIDERLHTWAQSKGGSEPSIDLMEKITSKLRPSITAVKPIPSHGALTLIFLGISVACVAALVLAMDEMGIRHMTSFQLAAIAIILAVAAGLLSAVLAWRMVPGSAARFGLTTVLALSGMTFLAAVAFCFPWRVSLSFGSQGWPCAALELGVALPAATLFWFITRVGAPFAGPGLGAAVSGLGVVLGLAVVQAQCMFLQAPHLIVWHGGTAVVLVGCSALLGHASRRWGRA